MVKALAQEPQGARTTRVPDRNHKGASVGESTIQQRILECVGEVRILDPKLCRELIQERQQAGRDRYDEVWNGVYVMSPLANNPHQRLVNLFTNIFFEVVQAPRKGEVLPGANVSDRESGWEHNYRDPDVVVVLNGSHAVDCGTHWMGGPDFLTEIQSPGDETDAKIPFYGQIQVRELLIVHRDTKDVRLFRHDGQQLVQVQPKSFKGGKWLVSEVLPLAFRRKMTNSGPHVEVRRTDGQAGHWTV